jgi:succinate dehydrogenase/fumarate reductase flavoprotein subunit
MLVRLQAAMSDDVGPLRTEAKLKRARAAISDLTAALGVRPFGDGRRFDMARLDWFDLRNMLLVARAVTDAAISRTESRGAHQREDHPGMLPEWRVNQQVRMSGNSLSLTSIPASPMEAAAQ